MDCHACNDRGAKNSETLEVKNEDSKKLGI